MIQFTKIDGMCDMHYADVQSKSVGDTIRIQVAPPLSVEPGKTYPVLYMLDGNLTFGTASEIARNMSIGAELPACYVVGIGYPVESALKTLSIRARDLTPNKGGTYEEQMMGAMGMADHGLGGGPKFLEFLLSELKPMIEHSFPVDPHDSILAGCSLGGLFPTWVLLTRPESFNRYACISPAIWWNKEEVWQWEEDYAAENNDLKAQVFFVAGGLETVEMNKVQLPNIPIFPESLIKLYDEHGWPRMAEITPEITAKLKSRAYPGLEVHCFNMPDETHMSVTPPAITRSLRLFFGHWQVPAL